MKIPDSETRKKVQSNIINRLEKSTAKGFMRQMVLTTILTYLAAEALITLIDLCLFEFIIGGSNFTGLVFYFIGGSLLSFIPIAVLSVVLVWIMTKPIVTVMKRNERGEQISNDEFFEARKRSIRIPVIIFSVNLVYPVLSYLLLNGAEGPVAETLVVLAKNISIFALAALVQNAIYQRILVKPRAIMKVYSIDESSKNWFVANMDRIQLYASAVLIAAILFHSSMSVLREVTGDFPDEIQELELSAEREAPGKQDPLAKMRQNMQQNQNGAVEDFEDTATFLTGNYALLFLFMVIIVMVLIKTVDTIVTKAKLTQTKILRHVLSDMASGSGDLTQRVLIVQADETGKLSYELNRVLDRLQTMLKNITVQTAQVAESSRAVSAVLENTVAAAEEMAASVSQINSNTTKNRTVVENSRDSLNKMLGSLEQINSNVNTQAAYVEQTSSAMTEMIANIQSVNEVTSKANQVSESLKTVSDSGGQAVLNSITAVRDIEESSNEVNSLVQIISRILAATNMLAMNAAIEAAHAGDAGRGFAVVAEEVRNLADDSTANLKTISANIKDVIDRVNRGVELSETAGEALSQVSDRTNETTRLMSEVASAMQEQAAGANEVLSSINSLVEASASINKLSEEQHRNNDVMKANLENTVNAFSEVQSATEELEYGNREILAGIDELKEVINRNESVVAALQDEIGGFKI